MVRLLHEWLNALQSGMLNSVKINSNGIPADSVVEYVTDDSRDVVKNTAFFAYPGLNHDGRDYIAEACAKGATVVFYEQQSCPPIVYAGVVMIPVDNLKYHVPELMALFYEQPSEKMQVVGITGTNGKTTCAYLLAQALADLGENSAIIGTLGYGPYNDLTTSSHTTPFPAKLQRCLADMHESGVGVVAMEVSSHALEQRRVASTAFDIAVFTNLSHDHLDYHHNMAAYLEAKSLLFKDYGAKSGVINVDDASGKALYQSCRDAMSLLGVSMDPDNDIDGSIITGAVLNQSLEGMQVAFKSPWGEGILTSTLLGQFNAYNLLTIFAILGLLGYSADDIIPVVSKLAPPPGRMDLIRSQHSAVIVVDYAHTPDALQHVLELLKPLCKGTLWCLFGCGGDRDQDKRSLMGAVAERIADRVMITNDNPRHEDPEAIVADILSGMNHPGQALITLDRSQAIASVIEMSQDVDVIVVAGKGHETYQIIGDQQLACNDKETALNILRKVESYEVKRS